MHRVGRRIRNRYLEDAGSLASGIQLSYVVWIHVHAEGEMRPGAESKGLVKLEQTLPEKGKPTAVSRIIVQFESLRRTVRSWI